MKLQDREPASNARATAVLLVAAVACVLVWLLVLGAAVLAVMAGALSIIWP